MSDDTKDTEFYSAFDGTKGRPESVYLDMQERQQAERSRAIAEKREPETDLSKLPAAVGTALVVEANRVDNSYYSNPAIIHDEPKDVDPISTLPVSQGSIEDAYDDDADHSDVTPEPTVDDAPPSVDDEKPLY